MRTNSLFGVAVGGGNRHFAYNVHIGRIQVTKHVFKRIARTTRFSICSLQIKFFFFFIVTLRRTPPFFPSLINGKRNIFTTLEQIYL